mgnify:CR=1 FL=1
MNSDLGGDAMTRIHVLVFTVCFLIISGFLGEKGYADKGRPYYEETGEVVWDINTEDKIVALTFDDGPHPSLTPWVLGCLKQFHAKATFFVDSRMRLMRSSRFSFALCMP